MTQESLNAIDALLIEPLQNLTRLLQTGDIPGDQAGALIGLVLAGGRAELARQVRA